MTTDTASAATDEDRRFDRRLSGRMTETDAVLWTVVLVVTVADVVTTISGLANGLQEGNVVVREMIESFGLAGFWVVKFLALCWLVAGWHLLSDRKGTAFLAVFGLVTMVVVFHNAMTMLGL